MEIPVSIYSCFIGVLYDLRRILALTFDVFGRFYLREMIHGPVSDYANFF